MLLCWVSNDCPLPELDRECAGISRACLHNCRASDESVTCVWAESLMTFDKGAAIRPRGRRISVTGSQLDPVATTVQSPEAGG